jgi:hypothetical protein
MSTTNPEYNPDWKVIHDYHRMESDHLNERSQVLTDRDNELSRSGERYNSEERTAIENEKRLIRAERDVHDHICEKTLTRMRFPTVQEYAAFVFNTFDPANGERGSNPPAVDFEKFISIDEVNAAWSTISEGFKEARNARIRVKPIDGPGPG